MGWERGLTLGVGAVAVIGGLAAGANWLREAIVSDIIVQHREDQMLQWEVQICDEKTKKKGEFKTCLLEYARFRGARENKSE